MSSICLSERETVGEDKREFQIGLSVIASSPKNHRVGVLMLLLLLVCVGREHGVYF